jgi:hypothetical protein
VDEGGEVGAEEEWDAPACRSLVKSLSLIKKLPSIIRYGSMHDCAKSRHAELRHAHQSVRIADNIEYHKRPRTLLRRRAILRTGRMPLPY